LKDSKPARDHVVWIGGRFVDPSEATVSVLDRGWLLGDGVFATMRAYDGRCFGIAQHLVALREGTRALGLEMPGTMAAIAEIANEAAQRTKAKNAYVRVTVSRGATAFIARPLDVPSDEEYATGIETMIVGPRRIPPECIDPTFKTTSYAPQIVAWREIEARGIREGIQLALDGTIACGTTSNFFLVMDGALVTPPTSTGCRPGVTRRTVIDIAEKLGVPVLEERIPLAALDRAEEAFFTSSRIELLPIKRASSARGFPLTTKLRQAFAQAVLDETVQLQ
jgi:branched-chain amino acid aminotransferase